MAHKLKGEPIQLVSLAKKTFLDLPETENFEKVLLASDDEVVGAYEHFFQQLAKANLKLSTSAFKKALGNFMKGDPGKIDAFAHKVVRAQQHCKAKSKQMVTGAKVADAVRRVAMYYRNDKPTTGPPGETLAAFQCSLKSSSSHAGSSSMVVSDDEVVELPVGKPSPLQKFTEEKGLVAEAEAALERSKTMWGNLSPQRETKGRSSTWVPLSPAISIASSDAQQEKKKAQHCMLPHPIP